MIADKRIVIASRLGRRGNLLLIGLEIPEDAVASSE